MRCIVNGEPRISAVIPAYNVRPYLRRSIDSALSQVRRPLEILLVDDGSTDGTGELAKGYGDAIRYIFQENRGASVARNNGIQHARGDTIAFLDGDDEWRPRHLANAAAILQKHPELKWYGAPSNEYLLETGQLVREYVKREPGSLIDDAYFADYMSAFPPRGFFSTPTMVIRKEVFPKVGMFDPGKRYGEDLEMWFRIGLHYPKVGYCHEVAANIYKRSSSLTCTKKWDYQTSLRRFRKAEMLAEEVGQDARRRAEPRIMYWVTKLLKASISQSDCQAVREILAEYDKRLAPRWRWCARGFLVAPWAFQPMVALRNTVSPKQRAFRAHDLR